MIPTACITRDPHTFKGVKTTLMNEVQQALPMMQAKKLNYDAILMQI
jgi:hypothetical protein